MNKYLIFILLLLTLLLLNCPTDEGNLPTPVPSVPTTPGIGNPTPTPGITAVPTPGVTIIDTFNSHTSDVPPSNDWITDCITTYKSPFPSAKNRGITVIDYSANQKVLNLMYDVFAKKGTWGVGTGDETCYVYAQKYFHAPAAGTISFTYYHIGFNLPNNAPSYHLDFWIHLSNDIQNENNLLWSNSEAADAVPFAVHTETILNAGDYYLTWRVKKDTTLKEDEIYIDDIKFTYQ